MTDFQRKVKGIATAMAKLSQATAVVGHVNSRSVDKLGWLKAQGRDFLAVTPELTSDYVSAAQTYLDNTEEPNHQGLYGAISRAVRNRIVTRLESDGGDVAMTPLTVLYRQWKARKGYPALIGQLTKELYNKIKTARFGIE